MKYSIYLYACDASNISTALKNDESLLLETMAKFRDVGGATAEDVDIIQRILKSGISGDWPHSDCSDAFLAFHWLLETIAEPILVEELIEFRHWDYWLSTGLAAYFAQWATPFATPTSPSSPPAVLYLPFLAMKEVLADVPCHSISHDSQVLREELLEIIESVSADELDLLGVAIR